MVATECNGIAHHSQKSGTCLTDLLEEQAAKHPDETAFIHGHEHTTFQSLVRQSRAVGEHLLSLGARVDTCVGVFVEPAPELMTGVWGVLYAGSAYLPLSPDYPDDRLRYMIEDSGARLLLTQENLRARLAGLAPAGTTLLTVAEAMAAARDTDAGRPVGSARPDRSDDGPDPHHLAYVIYTSGSTGAPKGVMVEHNSIVSQMRWLHTVQGLDRSRRVLQKTPMSFDAAQWEILAPACGATVVLAPPGAYRDPDLLIQTIVTHDVTTVQCVPTLLQALLETGGLPRCTSLRQIFSGGEALSRAVARRCLTALPDCDLTNLYGPTECTINATAYTVDRATVAEGPTMIPIGTPVHGTELYVLDEQRSPVATGEVGELYIGGVQLARGYLGRPTLTAQRFVTNPNHAHDRSRTTERLRATEWLPADKQLPAGEQLRVNGRAGRLYRTGDLGYRDSEGVFHFVGRTDNQVKLRGYRIELDEIRLLIENHDWVRHAAVIVRTEPRTGFQDLVAFVELNPNEAALMDQGSHGAHHQSKTSRLQIRAQLSHLGCRQPAELTGRPVLALPGRDADAEQRRQAFARKTYRFFEGTPLRRDDLLAVLGRRPAGALGREVAELTLPELGELLRYFGPHHSEDRLLPKYAYASPGALYATQLYLETTGVAGLRPGYHYFHPLRHELVLLRDGAPGGEAKDGEAKDGKANGAAAGNPTARMVLHFVGRRQAIEPVYKNNIREVLEIEAGHMVGLFDEILPRFGLGLRPIAYQPATMDLLGCPDEDYYLGAFELVPYQSEEPADGPEPDAAVDIYLQSHPGKVADLPAGQYRYTNGGLVRVSDELVLKRHVIAINQQVYERANVGVTVISRTPESWLRYIELGRALQRLQMNDRQLGLMSSGYSSETGNDLPSARRFTSILRAVGADEGPSYFSVGGPVSEAQVRSEGMKEDVVHMQGPAEMIKDDLGNLLPDYMVPNRVTVLDRMPLTANGKVDLKALEVLDRTKAAAAHRPFVAPRTETERRIGSLWQRALRRDSVSVLDDFFESGGNSLIAVGLVNAMNRELGRSLPLQVLFEAPTVERLARLVDGTDAVSATPSPSSRLVPLHPYGSGAPIFCWPGLGGYPMNLRPLATRIGLGRPLHGIQAYGINEGETAYPTIAEMAAEDIRAIRQLQPNGPYTLWGYSFGARVAFEAAYQLERAGEQVEQLFLIAPGAPGIDTRPTGGHHQDADGKSDADDRSAEDPAVLGGEADYRDEAYLTILFSVFAGAVTGPLRDECLRAVTDEEGFVTFVSDRLDLAPSLVRRITRVVQRTYRFRYEFREIAEQKLAAPITIFKARGDDYTAVEHGIEYLTRPPTVIELGDDHYQILKEPGVCELALAIRRHLGVGPKEESVPHVNIKYFPMPLSQEQQAELVTAVTNAVRSAFQCDEAAISIALEPVDREAWHERVYLPEIVNRKDLLRKLPNY